MATENLLTYTEVDPSSTIAKIPSTVTWASLSCVEDAYLYKDKTADFFSGDFVHYVTVKATAMTEDGRVYFWALTNTIDDMKGIDDASGSYLGIYFSETPASTYSIVLEECNGGSLAVDAYVISLNTTYYLKIVRDEAVPNYGRIYCYIYSDSARTTLLDTLTILLHTSKKDYQYLFATNSRNSGIGGRTVSGYAWNLTLAVALTPTVTTQEVTAVSGTTATGNGNIIDLGVPNPSAHGVCWNTTGTPDIDDNVTDEGAAVATGAFTTSITGLTETTKYYYRAYATNTVGTSYGVQFTFIAGTAGSAAVFPSEAITRVTSLIHRYNRATGEYNLEIGLGEVDVDFALPRVDLATDSSSPQKQKEEETEPVVEEAVEETKKVVKKAVVVPPTRVPAPELPPARVTGITEYGVPGEVREPPAPPPVAPTPLIYGGGIVGGISGIPGIEEYRAKKRAERLAEAQKVTPEIATITARTAAIITLSPEAKRRLAEMEAERKKRGFLSFTPGI